LLKSAPRTPQDTVIPFRVNTYVNGELVDYATREGIGGNEYSDEIVLTKVLDVDTSESATYSKNKQQVIFKEVNEVEIYNVNDFLTEVPTISLNNVTLPGPYNFIRSKYNSTLNLTGYLYGTSDRAEIRQFMFDFKRDIAISVVASTISTIFGTVIVAIGTLLGSLGVSFTVSSLSEL